MRSHAMLQIRFSRHRAGRITARWPIGGRIPTGLPVHLRNRHGVHRTGQLRRNLFELQRQRTVPRSDQQPEGPRLLSLHYWLGTFGELITGETARRTTPQVNTPYRAHGSHIPLDIQTRSSRWISAIMLLKSRCAIAPSDCMWSFSQSSSRSNFPTIGLRQRYSRLTSGL